MRCSGILLAVGWHFITDVSGKPVGLIFKVQAVQPLITRPLKMVPIGCPETPVRNYHPTLRKTPEERRSQKVALYRGWLECFIWNEGQVYVLVLWLRGGVALCLGGTAVSNGPIVGPLGDR
jgi:hypothetical protein